MRGQDYNEGMAIMVVSWFSRKMSKCDVFYPNTAFDVNEPSWPGSLFVPSSQCIFFRGILYIGGILAIRSRRQQRREVLWRFTPDCSQCQIPTNGYSLATYDSQLVLVGGMDSVSKRISSKLWTSSYGMNWKDETLYNYHQCRRPNWHYVPQVLVVQSDRWL